MYKVKNGKIIRKIAVRAFKYNKTRNIIGLLAICLTAILFTSVFSIGISALNSVQQTTMRQVGTQAHGGFKYLTMPQYEKLKSDSKIKDISYNIIVGTAENPELSKLYTDNQIHYVDNINDVLQYGENLGDDSKWEITCGGFTKWVNSRNGMIAAEVEKYLQQKIGH